MDEQFLKECLQKGLSTRDIEKLPNVNVTYRTINYYIRKYNLEQYLYYKKPKYNETYFSEIDTKEKAYILGYLLADGYINNSTLEFGCALADKEILEFIAKELNANIRFDYTFDKKSRRFPRARITIGNKRIIKDLLRYTIGSKENKTFPRIKKDLQHYMLLGFFDGDGCLTWGRRKDRNRLWQKVCFTGSYKLLYAIQKLLQKLNITSSLHPKGKENCYVLELASKEDVKKILSYMYGDEDLIILHRKFDKYNALRLELGEFDETTKSTTSSQANDHSLEGVETTGEKMVSLNNQLEDPSL